MALVKPPAPKLLHGCTGLPWNQFACNVKLGFNLFYQLQLYPAAKKLIHQVTVFSFKIAMSNTQIHTHTCTHTRTWTHTHTHQTLARYTHTAPLISVSMSEQSDTTALWMTPVVETQPHSNPVSTRMWDPVLYDKNLLEHTLEQLATQHVPEQLATQHAPEQLATQQHVAAHPRSRFRQWLQMCCC